MSDPPSSSTGSRTDAVGLDRWIIQILRGTRSSPLGRREMPPGTFWQVIAWWEARRIVFNLVVGAAGVLSGTTMVAIGAIMELLIGIPIGLPDPPIVAILGVILFAVGANVCYTGGWVAELLVRRAWSDEANQFATLMFTLGIWFAVVLTLAPAGLVAALAFIQGVAYMLGYAVPVE